MASWQIWEHLRPSLHGQYSWVSTWTGHSLGCVEIPLVLGLYGTFLDPIPLAMVILVIYPIPERSKCGGDRRARVRELEIFMVSTPNIPSQ
jgi:hypothetical protein